MPTRNVVLTERHEAFIKRAVAEGRYQNASEVLREGLRLIEAREAQYERKLAILKQAVQAGADAVATGDYVDFDNFEDLGAYLRQITDPILQEPEA